MPQSTPLDKIETNDIPDGQASDEERVQRIIQEMNSGDGEGGNEQHTEPPGGGQQQQPNYQYEQARQGQHPQMQHPQMQQGHMMPGHPMMGRPMGPMGGPPQYEAPAQQPSYEEAPAPPEPVIAKKNVFAHITDALKLPVVVTLIFFLFSLPIVDVYLAKYAHWAFSSGGQLSIPGLVIKAVAAGAVMGVYDTLDKVISRLF